MTMVGPRQKAQVIPLVIHEGGNKLNRDHDYAQPRETHDAISQVLQVTVHSEPSLDMGPQVDIPLWNSWLNDIPEVY